MSPRCAGRCKGTDRPALDAPVELVPVPDGNGGMRRVVVCTCCRAALRGKRVGPGDLGDTAPQLDPAVSRAGMIIFDDPVCGYNYRLLPELRAQA